MNGKNAASALLVFSLAAAGMLCLTATLCGLAGYIPGALEGAEEGLPALNIIIFGTAWCALLLLPGAWYALRRIQRPVEEAEEVKPSRLSGKLPRLLAVLLYPALIFGGAQAAAQAQTTLWLLPVLHVLAATIPVYVFSGIALNGLRLGSGIRRWGAFSVGLTLGPGLIMAAELTLIALVGLIFLLQISADPRRAAELMLLAQRLQFAQGDPATILNLLQPYLFQPMLLFSIAAFVVVFVPLIEEGLKPIGVWMLAGKNLTPEEGFALGILSGAGYALFENLFITSPGSEWVAVSIGRVGTTTMHLMTAGLLGYALTSAWRHNRFLLLGGLYLIAVLIHAAWNALTALTVAGAFTSAFASQGWIQFLELGGLLGLILLYLAAVGGLTGINRWLRRSHPSNHAIIARLPESPAVETNRLEQAPTEPAPEAGGENQSNKTP